MGETIDVDYCIVGAGPAGTVLATQLARTGKRIAVLEQGPSYGADKRAELMTERRAKLVHGIGIDFDHRLPSDHKNASISARGKESYTSSHVSGVGGASLHWMACTPRPRADDLQVRTLFGYGRDWPFDYRELEPWLLRAEHEFGVAGGTDNPYTSPRSGPFPMPAHEFTGFEETMFAPGARKLGWTAHSAPFAVNSVARDGRPACRGCRMCWSCPSGAKYSADIVHAPRMLQFDNVSLHTGMKLIRLEPDKQGGRIEVAHVVRLADGTAVAVRSKIFVLAMGGIETPRMLMLSNDHPRHGQGLGNAGGQLGRGFGDHLIAHVDITLREPVDFRRGFPTMICDHFRATSKREEHGSYYILMWPGASGEWLPSSVLTRQAQNGDTFSLRDLRAAVARSVSGMAVLELDGRYTMSLDRDNLDGFGNPWPLIEADLSEHEKAGLDHASSMLVRLGEAMGAVFVESWWSRGEKWWGAHPSGGTAMGRSPEVGVCDPNSRVFGLDNLYLASSSVFPHQGANNPTLTIAALSLRLAAHLETT